MKRCVIFASVPMGDAKYVNCSDAFVICADAGILNAKRLGVKIDLALGDFDSCEKCEAEGICTVSFPSRKDDTDLMLSVKYGIEMGCDDFTIYGALGGERIDHTLAAISALGYLRDNKIDARLEDDKCIIEMLSQGEYEIDSLNGYFSLFPYGCDRVPIMLEGTSYDGETLLMSSFPIGVSNEILDRKAKLTIYNDDTESRVLVIRTKK